MSTPTDLPTVGLVCPPDLAPESILRVAAATQDARLDELWFWEDCFATSGLAPAAAALGATDTLRVGIGLMPAPLRAPSLTAMEIATLAGMFPGRFRPGLGHGVQEWMGQAGVRVDSPLTLLREQVEAIGALLAGDTVTAHGRYVDLTDVELRWPPRTVPELLVGGRGPKTLALAGALSDGALLDDVAPSGDVDAERMRQAVETVRAARRDAGRDGDPQIVALLPAPADATAGALRERLTELASLGATTVAVVAGLVDGPPSGDERTILDLAERLGRTVAS